MKIMIRSVSIVLLLILTSFSLMAQEKVKKIARPDIPGSFVLDFGLTRGSHIPANFSQGFWGSRTLNIYYLYPLRIAKSKFSLTPGIGLAFDRFKLVNKYTLSPQVNEDGTFSLVPVTDYYVDPKKSMIVTNYLEVPLGFRFDTNPDDLARSFSISIGARAGVLYDAFTKIKYRENGETKEIKDKQNHGLNTFRYGLYSRIGVGSFNWFFNYNLSPYFAKNTGPDQTNMTTLTIGISVNGF
jgi:hypothetical protein